MFLNNFALYRYFSKKERRSKITTQQASLSMITDLLRSFFLSAIFSILLLFPPLTACSENYVEVTASGNRQLTVAIAPPILKEGVANRTVAQQIVDVALFDLNISGVVKAEKRDSAIEKSVSMTDSDYVAWKNSGADLLLKSEYSLTGDDLTVEYRLYDLVKQELKTARRLIGKTKDVRRFSHIFDDEILLSLTGEKGCFTSKIAFSSNRAGGKEIFIMDWDGYNRIQLTKNGSININPSFSPDGRDIIFTSYKKRNPDLYKRALASAVELPISRRSGINITGAWSPDGSKIALAMSKDGNSEIYTVSKNGDNPQRLTINPAIEVSPSWSPDGKYIAFVSDRNGKPQIFRMNSDGSDVKKLTHNSSYSVTPAWSPKGDRILYSKSGGGFQIHSMNIDGGDDIQLTTAGNNENPSWSPDGRFIVFSSTRDGAEAIYIMRADGSGQTRISDKGVERQPAWSPRY